MKYFLSRLIFSVAWLCGATFLIGAPSALASSRACEDLFHGVDPVVKLKPDSRSQSLSLLTSIRVAPKQFDYSEFHRVLILVKTALKEKTYLNPTDFKTPESKLAFLEAVNRHKNSNRTSFENLLRNASPNQQRRILSRLVKLSSREGFKQADVGDLMVDLYLMTQANPETLSFVFGKGRNFSKATKDLIRMRIEAQLLRSDPSTALVELGMLRPEQPVLDSTVRSTRFAWALGGRVLKSILTLNPIGLLPAHEMQKTRKELDADIAAQLNDNAAFDSLYPKLAAKLGREAQFQLVWSISRHVVADTLMMVAVVVLTEDLWKIGKPYARKMAPQQMKVLDELFARLPKNLTVQQKAKLYDDAYKVWRDQFEPYLGPDIDSSKEAKDFRAMIYNRPPKDIEAFLKTGESADLAPEASDAGNSPTGAPGASGTLSGILATPSDSGSADGLDAAPIFQ